MASLLDNEKDIEREAALHLVTKTIDDVTDIYSSADLKSSIKLAGLTSILYEHRSDKEFPKTNELPSTYNDLKQTKLRLEKNVDYLRAENMSLLNKAGKLSEEVIGLKGKIRAMEIMMGWFVHEFSKLDKDPNHQKGLDLVMEARGIEEASREIIRGHAISFGYLEEKK